MNVGLINTLRISVRVTNELNWLQWIILFVELIY